MFENFTYYNPVKIIFGKGTIAKINKNIPKTAKIMITYGGGSIFKNGVMDQVKEALKGFNYIEFGGIEANPTFETLMKAVEIGRKENIDFLLAVGGGSVLDGTKFIAAALPFTEGDEWENIVQANKYKVATDIGAVLTLPATGSEMNYYAVISHAEKNEKKGMGNALLYPKFSVLDPETTFTLPKRQVANGLADAFVHTMEQYLTFPVGAQIQDRFAESILKTLIEIAPKAINEENDYETRANLMWSATVALNGLIGLGVPQDWATHQIGHELTALHGVDHARTLAVVLPHLLNYKKTSKFDKLLQYGKRVWGLSGDDEQIVNLAIQKTADFFESLEIPTKASFYDINLDTVNEIRSRFMNRKVILGEKQDILPDDVAAILELSIA